MEGTENRLTPKELGLLAKELAIAASPIEAARIKERLIHGFYGSEGTPETESSPQGLSGSTRAR